MPLVAAIVVLRIAASPTRANTSRTRSRAGRNPTSMRSVVPTTASSVFPTEMNAGFGESTPRWYVGDEGREGDGGPQPPPVENERCQSDPVGAQTGVMSPSATSSSMPILAATTYATKRAAERVQ